jgi:hypothetical protein
MSKIRYLSDQEWSLVYLIGSCTLIPLLISSVILFPQVKKYFLKKFLFYFIKIEFQNFILQNWQSVIKLNYTSECFINRCNYYKKNITTCKNFDWNTDEYKNVVFLLRNDCNPIYYAYVVLSWLNFVCILGIFILQSLLIVWKFYFLFIIKNFNESEHHAIMKDEKVVVHSF